ncbi:hypothetical protein B0T26DRAFT_673539 [Lasiosphaeria miniovina]|uniref:Uncharacterized protein n=1 Tax=Lasiosphaeria miniovina TaxID=1954250 RepID=A0AA40ATM9_9PEZI|nr:uncharacterized protein B0T26DRAFT_673539 [Lasiosphaeria miniovina]KAK0721751.1 hypothetical protein B0T26DRAFT_673539 [Lasiosphaeria miniovina]
MKNAVLAIFSLGVVGLVSAHPVPAGGFYPPPYGSGIPDPFLGGTPPGGGIGKTATQMCNCNNPATKETSVQPFCEQAGGQDQFRVFEGVEPIQQHMCILSSALSDVYSNSNCQKQFGPDFNAFCANYL